MNMAKCRKCRKQKGTELVCRTCLSEMISNNMIKENPLIFQESVEDIFKDTIKPQLDEIQRELERIKIELRIRKVKKK